MEFPDEKRLIESCQNSNLEDFAQLYDSYVTPIFRFVQYRVQGRMLAEDLVSQTFLKALENIRSYDPTRGTFSAWLYRIARNLVIDHYRSHKDHQVIDEDWDAPSDEDATERVKRNMAKKQVQEALATLDSEKRDIVLLRLWDDLSYKEIAQITGKSEVNCKVIFSRTIAGLRETLPASSFLLLILFPAFR